MAMLGIIMALSMVIWYLIDRFKPLWENAKGSKFITIGIACVLGIIAVLTFKLDVLVATGIVGDVSVFGQICTVLLYMAGSSAFAEIIERIKGGKRNDD